MVMVMHDGDGGACGAHGHIATALAVSCYSVVSSPHTQARSRILIAAVDLKTERPLRAPAARL